MAKFSPFLLAQCLSFLASSSLSSFSKHFALPMIDLKDSSSIISNFFIPGKILFIVSLFTRMETPWFKYVLLTLCCTLYVQNVRKLIVVSDKINKCIDVSSNL